MDKGQHLRLIFWPASHEYFVALCTQLSFHLSAATENTTTKDSTDGGGTVWDEFDVTQRSGDINFTAIIAVGTDTAEGESWTFNDFIGKVINVRQTWKLCMASGDNNRTVGKTICSGVGTLSNLQVQAQNKNLVTFSGTLTNYGEITVGND